ncbi:hypothetical protein LTR56_027500 [Elasticomyces elasticus]|nr:hypothetical protein LTR56_027500 [Elasticomyces elasticus]KAK4895990.1 hypothetical protein LTR49_028202 [Elasticomyces elasticus]
MIKAFHTQKKNTGTLALEQEVEYVKAETTEQARLRKAEMDEDRADEGDVPEMSVERLPRECAASLTTLVPKRARETTAAKATAN